MKPLNLLYKNKETKIEGVFICSECGIEPKSKPIKLATGEFGGYWYGCKCKHEIRLNENDAKQAYFK